MLRTNQVVYSDFLECPLTLRVKCTVRFTAKQLVYQTCCLTSAFFGERTHAGGGGHCMLGAAAKYDKSSPSTSRVYTLRYV